jgi:hypothetical protein
MPNTNDSLTGLNVELVGASKQELLSSLKTI